MPFMIQVDSNYLYTNNIFLDPINNNFELKPNSFAVNTGIKNEYTIDYFGTLPDKGAYEYGKTELEQKKKLNAIVVINFLTISKIITQYKIRGM